MIKSIIFILAALALYSTLVKKYIPESQVSNKKVDKEVLRQNENIIQKVIVNDEMGAEVKELKRYRLEMLEKVNEINSIFRNPEKMTLLKKLIGENNGLAKLKKVIGNDENYNKLKVFILKFGISNTRFFQPGQKLTGKDSKFFEVNQPMTLDEYKKKFNLED